MSRTLTFMWDPIDTLDGSIEALSEVDLGAEFDIEGLAELVYAKNELYGLARQLENILLKAAGRLPEKLPNATTTVSGFIDTLDHPVVQRVLARRKEARDLAAAILRVRMKEVRDGDAT